MGMGMAEDGATDKAGVCGGEEDMEPLETWDGSALR